MAAALHPDATLVHPELEDDDRVDGNVTDRVTQDIGDVEAEFDEADRILEDRFRFPALSA